MNAECPIQNNISLLKNPKPTVRRAAAEALGSMMTPRAVQPLIDLLQTEENIEVRRSIVLSLSLLGGDKIYPILMDVLTTDSDVDTKRNAAGGLRFYAEKINTLDLVSLMLKEQDKTLRGVLVSTIIYLKDHLIIAELIDLFARTTSPVLRECLLEIIGSYDDPRTKELIIVCSQPENTKEIRLIATHSMGKLDDVKMIPHLFEVFSYDEDEEVRKLAEKILDELSVILGYVSIDQMVLAFLEQSK